MYHIQLKNGDAVEVAELNFVPRNHSEEYFLHFLLPSRTIYALSEAVKNGDVVFPPHLQEFSRFLELLDMNGNQPFPGFLCQGLTQQQPILSPSEG